MQGGLNVHLFLWQSSAKIWYEINYLYCKNRINSCPVSCEVVYVVAPGEVIHKHWNRGHLMSNLTIYRNINHYFFHQFSQHIKS